MTPITKDSLIEYGMVECPDNPIFPLEKVLGENGDGETLAICLTVMRNVHELCLQMPNGTTLFLAIESIEQLQAFENCIAEFDEG